MCYLEGSPAKNLERIIIMTVPLIFPLFIAVPPAYLSLPVPSSYLLLLGLHGDLAGWGSVGRQDKTAFLPAPSGEIVGSGEPHPSPPHTSYPFSQAHTYIHPCTPNTPHPFSQAHIYIHAHPTPHTHSLRRIKPQ